MSKLTLKRVSQTVVFSTILFGVVHCGSGTDTSTTPIAPTLTSLYANVFSQACLQCHNETGGAPSGTTLDFTSITTAYSTLLGTVGGLSTAGNCSSVKIVNPGDPSTSYLAAVLISSDYHTNFVETGCSPYATHLQDQNLSAAEQTALVGWIQNGAQNN